MAAASYREKTPLWPWLDLNSLKVNTLVTEAGWRIAKKRQCPKNHCRKGGLGLS